MVKRAAWLTLALVLLPACVSAYGGYYRNPKKRSKTAVVQSTGTASGISLPSSFGSSGFGSRTTAPAVSAPQTSVSNAGASSAATPSTSTSAVSGASDAQSMAGSAAAAAGITGNSAGPGGPSMVVAPADSSTTLPPGTAGPGTPTGDPGKDISCPPGMHREASGCVPGTTGLLGAPSSAGHAVAQ